MTVMTIDDVTSSLLDHAVAFARNGRWLGGKFLGLEHVLFGSDWPHPSPRWSRWAGRRGATVPCAAVQWVR